MQVMNQGGSVDNKQRLTRIQKLWSKRLSLHHKSTLKTQGRHLWVVQHPVSKLTALRWGSVTENSDSWSWVWFKPDLVLYQKLDFILFIHYDKNMHLPFKLWPRIKTTFQKSFTREKRALFNHHKAMGKCIVSSTFLWSSFPLNVNLCYNHDSFLLSFSQISISKRLKHLYICALNIIWLA